ncbi:MAG: SDR family NAD(P)-dependent oxidoreductase [Proteobacteria bacterium]|nr:SDR family NAD(P)-dependent oxidoreductase [Pseudomonadota bacterium]
MKTHLYLLTGASRGLGAAMAEQLLAADHRVVCISRRRNSALADRACALGAACEQWELDLAQPVEAAARVGAWLAEHDAGTCLSATLINNAAALPRIAPLADSDAEDLSTTLRVGLEAPLLLTAAFLHATRDWNVPRRVLNISSGLGRRAMAAQSAYCAVKAGMDHYTRAVALEEGARPNGARIVSLAPGVIDTDMQVQLRAADPDGFPDRARFIGLKDEGQLVAPADAARRVLACLARADFGSEAIGDVRDA